MANPIFVSLKNSNKLPSPTGVALEAVRLAGEGDATISAIAEVIASDPAITSRILKLVNSPIAGVARPIASITQAVALLGLRAVKSIALGFSLVANHRSGHCEDFDYDEFWSSSLARGVAARAIAGRAGSFAPDEAFTCALLCRVGQLAFASAQPESYGLVLREAVDCDMNTRLVLERDMFGIDHLELTAELMADWHLPGVFCDAARRQDDPDAEANTKQQRATGMARILHCANVMAKLLTRDEPSARLVEALQSSIGELSIPPQDIEGMFDDIRSGWRETGAVLSINTREVPSFQEIIEMARERRTAMRDRMAVSAHESPFSVLPGEQS